MAAHGIGRAKKDLGDRGEALVVAWLQQQGWHIVAQQWHCRWGELDLVAQHPKHDDSCLAFVEVKTRRRGSLDHDGRLAITAQKRRKLWRSAEAFLYTHPRYSEWPCRFDVALVAHRTKVHESVLMTTSAAQPPILALVEYIEDAFQ